jgi:hypothetical protein
MSEIPQEDLVRARSKRLFGSAYRLEVAAAIGEADPGVVDVPSVTAAIGLPVERYTVIRLELENLARAGLVMRLPRPRGQRIQEYERLPSQYWAAARTVLEEVRRLVEFEPIGPD